MRLISVNQILFILFLSLNYLLFFCKPSETNKDDRNIFSHEVTKEEEVKLEISFKICQVAGDKTVTDIHKPIREEYKFPAIAAAIVDSNGIVAVGVVGIRKEGTQVSVTLNDAWTVGSCTKAMTATLIALFIESGKLRWDTNIGDVFSELPAVANPEFKKNNDC